MDVHKPKPVHNWRDFLKEVGTIVLGVSIALAAEQGMEWWHWRNEVTQARQAIATELVGSLHNSIVRLRTKDCTERRLDQLSDILDSAAKTGILPPVGGFAGPPRRHWSSGAWQSVVSSQVATHFPRQELSDLGRLYTYIAAQDSRQPDEASTWSKLSTVIGPGRRLDPASEANLRNALSEARGLNRQSVISAHVILNIAHTLNPSYSESDLAFIAKSRDENPMAVRPFTFAYMAPEYLSCQPLGAVPPRYGQTNVFDAPGVEDAGMKLLPDTGRR